MKNHLEKENVEFRYYEMPQGMPVLPLLGEKWITHYGADPMHFHNYLEFGYCYSGKGIMHLGDQLVPYRAGTVIVIPRNFLHRTEGEDNNLQKWEYLYVDSEKFLQEQFFNRGRMAEELIARLHSRMFVITKEMDLKVGKQMLILLDELREKNEFYADSVKNFTFLANGENIKKNAAPVFEDLEGDPFNIKAGETVSFQLKAADPEEQKVTLSVVSALPKGASFDAETGTFTWETSDSDSGRKEITFKAVDEYGASTQKIVTINIEEGIVKAVNIAAAEDTYLAGWKSEKNNTYSDNEYLRVCRMGKAISDLENYGLFGEKITSTSDGNDAKISVLKFDVSDLKKNIKNLEKAELELTLINRRSSSATGTDRLMVVPVSGEWDAKTVTWNTHPEWDTENVAYSEAFQVDKNSEVKNNIGITASNYDGTKAIVDVTEFIKNMENSENTLSLAICDENGYELAFASTEGAAKLDAEKEAAPVIRATVKKVIGKDSEVSRTVVSQDTFAGSWSGDQSADFGAKNFLRTSYGTDSKGTLGTASGSDNKVTYLKFDVSQIDLSQIDRVKLQMTLLGVRYSEAANLDAQLQIAMAENTDWTENSLNWKNKPAILDANGVITSEEFNLGNIVSNDPAMISTPNGTVATADVTSFVEAAKAAGQDSITLAVNMVGKSVDKANRIFFVSKEGAESYANAENMAPVLVSTKTVAVSGIKVNAPTKTVYDLGESLDTTGMTVTASHAVVTI